MKKLCFLLIMMAPVLKMNAQVVYYTPVKMPPAHTIGFYTYMDTKAVAEDVAELLSTAAGKHYTAKPNDNNAKEGIFLLLDSNLSLSSNEAALISSDGATKFVIKARYITGLSYAAYTYLNKLGFKFYLPGKDWTIIPNISNIFLSRISKEEWKPYFRNRWIGISGGMQAVKGLDESRNNLKEWNVWYRRNRMGCDYLWIDGHIGEAFNMGNKDLLQKDSMMLAPVEGRRQYDTYAKLDPTYQKGVKTFIEWITGQYELTNRYIPGFMPKHRFQTVDPGDGLEYCHTPECEARFKTVSDQVFFVANEAARAIRKKYPEAGVSLYAYTERADTPSFKLEQNVHVGIVSGAYQDADTPEGLIRRWAKKTKQISLYEYLNIGVWCMEEPYFNFNTFFNYLKNAKTIGIEGFIFEAAASKFSAGLQQYFTLKYLCEPYQNIDEEFKNLCDVLFKEAAPSIREMFREWYFNDVHLSTGYIRATFEEHEIGRFVKYLEAASAKTNSEIVKKRLEELKAYIVILAGEYDYLTNLQTELQQQKDPSVKKRIVEKMLNFSWRTYSKNIFHNTQFNDMAKEAFLNDPALLGKWNYSSSDYFATLDQNSSALIEDEFKKIKARFLPKALPGARLDNSFFENASRYSADSICIKMIDESNFPSASYNIELYCPAPGNISVRYNAGKSNNKKPIGPNKGFVMLYSDDNGFSSRKNIPLKTAAGGFSFFLPVKGHYKLSVGQMNSTAISFVIQPGKNLLYVNKTIIPMNYIQLQDPDEKSHYANKYLAFYVPAVDSVSYRFLYATSVNTLSFYNSKGQPVSIDETGKPDNLVYRTTAADKNSFMYFSNTIMRWPPNMKNIPPYYFFLRFPLKK